MRANSVRYSDCTLATAPVTVNWAEMVGSVASVPPATEVDELRLASMYGKVVL